MSRAGNLGAYLFLGIFIVVGIGLTYYGTTMLITSNDSMHWPTASGTVLNSTYTTTHEHRNVNNHYVDVTYYWPHVSYQYMVSNVSYTSSKITLISSGSDHYSSVATILGRYPVGQTVTVHYNPSDPSQAILETDTQGAPWAFIGGGLLFAVAGGAALMWVVIQSRRMKKTETIGVDNQRRE